MIIITLARIRHYLSKITMEQTWGIDHDICFFHADLTNQHGIDKVDSYFAKLVNITPRTMGDTCSELVFMSKSRPTHTQLGGHIVYMIWIWYLIYYIYIYMWFIVFNDFVLI